MIETLFTKQNFINVNTTRSLIFSFSVFHAPTMYYTNVNAVFELPATGFVTSKIIAARSFRTPI